MEKVFIFDFDGVLCDSANEAYKAHNELALKFQLPKIYNSTDYFNILDADLISKYIDNDLKEQYNLQHRNLMFDSISNTKLFENVEKIFQLPNCKYAIVSSTYEKTIKKVFEQSNVPINKLIYIYGRETIGTKTTKIESILKNLKLNKTDIVYVGDTYSDILFCEKLGIKILVSNYGYSNTINVISSNIIGRVNSVIEVIEFIKNYN